MIFFFNLVTRIGIRA